MAARFLYSAEFLASGCPSNEYNDAYAVDDTIWTYTTAYALAAIALLAGILNHAGEQKGSKLMTSYFLFTSAGYAISGVSYQTTETKNDWQYRILGPIGLGITLLGTACLMRSGLLYYFYPRSIIANVMWVASNSAVIILSCAFWFDVLATLWMVVIYGGMSAVYLNQAIRHGKAERRQLLLLKVLAMLINMTGFMIQYFLNDTCGADGLKDCFQSCPLVDASFFNNTAIKNVLVAVGIVFLGVAEILLPSHTLVESEVHDDKSDLSMDDVEEENSTIS